MPNFVVNMRRTVMDSYYVEDDTQEHAVEYWWRGALISSETVDQEFFSVDLWERGLAW